MLRLKGFLNSNFQNVGFIKNGCFLTFCIQVHRKLAADNLDHDFYLFSGHIIAIKPRNYMDVTSCCLISKTLKSKVNLFIANLFYNKT